jgi:hypothetical protein
MKTILVLIAAWVFVPRTAGACASCGCGDATLTATGVERPYTNRVRVALEERYGTLTGADDHDGSHVVFLRSTLALAWSPFDRLTLNATLPWLTSWSIPASGPSDRLSGLGDLELSARAVVFRERRFAPHHLLWLSGGLKLPTGYRLYDDQGFPYPDDDQPGSGSWDPLGGVTYAWFSGGMASAFASTSVRYTTRGRRDYRRGSSVGSSVAIQLQPFAWGAVVLGVDALWSQPDELPNGAAVPSTGGAVGYFAPGILLSPTRDLLFRIAVDVPVLARLDGTQTTGTQVAVSITYDLN